MTVVHGNLEGRRGDVGEEAAAAFTANQGRAIRTTKETPENQGNLESLFWLFERVLLKGKSLKSWNFSKKGELLKKYSQIILSCC